MTKKGWAPFYITEVGTDGVNVPDGGSLGGNMGQYVPEILLNAPNATIDDLTRLYPAEIRVGIGTNMFGVDSNGLWLGSTKWSTAPFRVSMAGVALATGYIQLFRQSTTPTSLHIKDIWYKTDTGAYYIAAIVGADAIAVGEWELSNPTSAWSTLTDDDGHKPDNDATVGATAGTDLKDSGAVVLGDTDIKNIYTLTAGIAITAGQAVYIASDGKVYPIDARWSYFSSFIGFALANISAAASGKIKVIGTIEVLSGLTAGSVYYLSDGADTLDQSQTNEDNSQAVAVSETNYQSFIAGATGFCSKVILKMGVSSGTESATIKIRSGAGTGGTLLATQGTGDMTGAAAERTITFSTPALLTSGQTYSITVTSSSTNVSWRVQAATNPYANGRADTGANDDYYFKTYYVSTYGAIGTSAGTNSKKVGIAISSTILMLLNS